MSDWKNLFASRTVWANFVGLGALVAGGFGIDLSGTDQEATTNALLQVVAGVSFLASTTFRILASKKLLV